MSLYDNDINPVGEVELTGRFSSLSTTSTLHSYRSISSFSSLETLTRSYTHTSLESLSPLIPLCATYIASQTGHSGKSKHPIDIPPRRPVPIYNYQSRSKAHSYHPLPRISSESAALQDHELAINQYGTPPGYQEYHLPSTQEKPNIYSLHDRYSSFTRKPKVDPDDQIIQITEPVLDTPKSAHLRDSSTSHHGTKFEPQIPGMKRPSCPYFGSAASLYHNEYACCFSKNRAITLPIPTDGNCKEYALLPVPVTATLVRENRKSKTLILWPWVLKMEFKTQENIIPSPNYLIFFLNSLSIYLTNHPSHIPEPMAPGWRRGDSHGHGQGTLLQKHDSDLKSLVLRSSLMVIFGFLVCLPFMIPLLTNRNSNATPDQ